MPQMTEKKKKATLAAKVADYIKQGQDLYKMAMSPIKPSTTLHINRNQQSLLKKVN